jgi:hypothetical protein
MEHIKLYAAISRAVQARQTCLDTHDLQGMEKHTETLVRLEKLLPHSAKIDLAESRLEKLVFNIAFRHDPTTFQGVTEHSVVVTPSLAFNFHLRVSGQNIGNVRALLAREFREGLQKLVENPLDSGKDVV